MKECKASGLTHIGIMTHNLKMVATDELEGKKSYYMCIGTLACGSFTSLIT